jgi:hypothetical protein
MTIIGIINAIVGSSGSGGPVPPPVYDYIIAENTDNIITEDGADVLIIE